MNSKTNLKILMKQKLDRSVHDSEVIAKSVQQYANKSFSNTKRNTLQDSAFMSKRQSQEFLLSKLSTPKCKFENTSQRSISPAALYQMPDSLQKIYKQIHNKINQQKKTKQKTEEAKCVVQVDQEEIIQQLIQQEECVQSILAVVTLKKKVIKLCQTYMASIPNSYPEHGNLNNQKIIQKSVLLERLGLLVVLHWAVGEDDDVQNIKNLLLYIHQGMLINLKLLTLIQLSESSKQLLSHRMMKIKNNRKFQNMDINQLRKNSNVVHSLLILLIENSEEFKYNKLEMLLLNIETLPLAKGTQSILGQFNKIQIIKETLDTEHTLDHEGIDEISSSSLSMSMLPKTDKKFTLVIDLDETLVHYQELVDDGQFLVRPFAETFLYEMSKYYEIVIFTAAMQEYADFILDLIDEKRVISHRLYRQHTTYDNGTHVKDLSRIGRSLKSTIIIDNLPENFKFQPENGIYIQSWYGEAEDRALFQLAPLLKQIVMKRYSDVRDALRKFRDQMLSNIENGIIDPHLHLKLE